MKRTGAVLAMLLAGCVYTPEDARDAGPRRVVTVPGKALPVAQCLALRLESEASATTKALRELPPDYAMITMRYVETNQLVTLIDVRQRGGEVEATIYSVMGRAVPDRESAFLDMLAAAIRACAGPAN